MSIKNLYRIFASILVLGMLLARTATPVLAFDGRGGETITIPAGEVINDDLYIGASQFTLDGTVRGDLFSAGSQITVNGEVDGDVFAAGQSVVVNGTVTGSVHLAGAALQVGDNAKISGDVVGVGGSLEVRKGSSIGRDVAFAGGQSLLAGNIGRNVKVATGGLEISGKISGDANVVVGNSENGNNGPLFMMPNSTITIPAVKAGLSFDPGASINGNLNYESSHELTIPSSIVAGKITYTQPKSNPEQSTYKQPTVTENVINGILDIVRNIVTLSIFGLLLVWLFPGFMKDTIDRVKTAPLASLGWGIVSWAAVIFAGLVIIVAMFVGGIGFGLLSLNSISGTIVWLCILALLVLVVGFVLAASFIAQIIVSLLGGKLILTKIQPGMADSPVWPLLLGTIVFALLASIPFFGAVVRLAVMLLGLGGLWYYGSRILQKNPVA